MASFPRHRGEQELPLIAESRAGFEFWPRVPRESPTHSDVAPRSERHGTPDGLSMQHEISGSRVDQPLRCKLKHSESKRLTPGPRHDCVAFQKANHTQHTASDLACEFPTKNKPCGYSHAPTCAPFVRQSLEVSMRKQDNVSQTR